MGTTPYEADERPPRPQDSKHLLEKHHVVLRMKMMGYRTREISQHTGLSEGFVSALLNSPLAQEQLKVLTSARDAVAVNVAATIQEFAPKAAKVLADVIENGVVGETPVSAELRVKASQDWLSRAGHSPIQRGAFEHTQRGVSVETLDTVKQRYREAKEKAKAEDADFEMVNNSEDKQDEEVDFGSIKLLGSIGTDA